VRLITADLRCPMVVRWSLLVSGDHYKSCREDWLLEVPGDRGFSGRGWCLIVVCASVTGPLNIYSECKFWVKIEQHHLFCWNIEEETVAIFIETIQFVGEFYLKAVYYKIKTLHIVLLVYWLKCNEIVHCFPINNSPYH
jgi:hypothetical protein